MLLVVFVFVLCLLPYVLISLSFLRLFSDPLCALSTTFSPLHFPIPPLLSASPSVSVVPSCFLLCLPLIISPALLPPLSPPAPCSLISVCVLKSWFPMSLCWLIVSVCCSPMLLCCLLRVKLGFWFVLRVFVWTLFYCLICYFAFSPLSLVYGTSTFCLFGIQLLIIKACFLFPLILPPVWAATQNVICMCPLYLSTFNGRPTLT